MMKIMNNPQTIFKNFDSLRRLKILSPVKIIFPKDENDNANLKLFEKLILNGLLSC